MNQVTFKDKRNEQRLIIDNNVDIKNEQRSEPAAENRRLHKD